MKQWCAAAAAALALTGLALAQETSFDFDQSADFSKFKTFTVKDGTKAGNPLVDNRIVAAIEAELSSKRMTRDDARSDVVVVYHVAFGTQKDISAYSTGYGGYSYRWGGGWGTTGIRVNEISVGTLVIDIADAARKAIMWRGIGVKAIDPQVKAAQRDGNITEAVREILRNFPPEKKA